MKKPLIPMTVNVTAVQYAALKAASEYSGESLSTVCRVLLTRQLTEQHQIFGGRPTIGLDALTPDQRWAIVYPFDVGVKALMDNGKTPDQAFRALSLTDKDVKAMLSEAEAEGDLEWIADIDSLSKVNQACNRILTGRGLSKGT